MQTTTWRRLLTPLAVTATAMGAFLATAPQASAVPSASEGAAGKVFTSRASSYTPGLGMCGHHTGPMELAIAVNSAQFGNRKSCGRVVRVTHGKRVTKAVVRDECRCGRHGISLSHQVFRNLTGRDNGTINVKWSFIE